MISHITGSSSETWFKNTKVNGQPKGFVRDEGICYPGSGIYSMFCLKGLEFIDCENVR